MADEPKTCSPYLRLVHIVATRKWCFKDGKEIVNVGTAETYFETRMQAVQAARAVGLIVVDKLGCVKAVSELVPAWIRKWQPS